MKASILNLFLSFQILAVYSVIQPQILLNRKLMKNFRTIAAVKSDSSSADFKSAAVQFMITTKMKQTLMSDFGYTEEEVASMEPEVARIIISKQLRRPSNGMPKTWRRGSSRNLVSRQYIFFTSHLKKIFCSIISPFFRIDAGTVLLFGGVLSVSYFGITQLNNQNTIISKGVKKLHSIIQYEDQKSKPITVDFAKLDQVRRFGFIEKISSKINSLKDKYL